MNKTTTKATKEQIQNFSTTELLTHYEESINKIIDDSLINRNTELNLETGEFIYPTITVVQTYVNEVYKIKNQKERLRQLKLRIAVDLANHEIIKLSY